MFIKREKTSHEGNSLFCQEKKEKNISWRCIIRNASECLHEWLHEKPKIGKLLKAKKIVATIEIKGWGKG